MQRNLLHGASQLAHGTCWFFPHTTVLQCLKGQSMLSNVGCKVILALDPSKRCLHAGAAHFASKKTAFPSQPADTPHKEERNPLPSATDTPKQSPAESDPLDPDPLQDKSISLVQRFKKTFKQYGKVMIPVHLLTSTVWFGSFYYAAMNGVNVVPFLELIGLPDSVTSILKNSQGGNALTAYALYKIATPARYTVTLGGTSITVKYLRKSGYISTPPPVKEYLQDRMEETKDKITEKMEETKDKITEKMEETKDKITEKIQETKDKVSFKKIKE
ncbi:PREDICTED: protein FAM210A [Lepidothrix coronata]|uniref:Protein FAM210A n=1 Tax=Lepidothrix coronata TaxID=321398 RepID=A0A6J0HK73_9PASS|nr:PREDICTED: protein FAM210A [Lepidothrix coronata]XP_017674935.1 PREDICTED: protein FAM210A [Lepidothrix coronata]XP_017674936.1 PREDICTED: protein FAM210A [Lepidothrix coronata]XP_017674937.1 PREDICTED: protein FAM210A [Lepidothrix coronata]XP_017674938.1 PREDICTED: protein FAM210A [Lepidothrix coronata]XP_017674939.1 PREDICTED: protein FAM210A [Lepidothrix coronata]XP_017674940.1 PREDICTED: protein FAM210A [Lepidothrix coronata]